MWFVAVDSCDKVTTSLTNVGLTASLSYNDHIASYLSALFYLVNVNNFCSMTLSYVMARHGHEIILQFSTVVQQLNSITCYITCLPVFYPGAL